ncbi:hypothetical protein [Aeromicrobium sp. IC_218]|uniref:hypothetical protein n=1 Tax=Aeromicrobium sp. IC_218 TaxID=2545468 RepID=UPI00104047AD|nr:hypothetical protein [Aeromicrobium sp. IC_218]TCI97821.1 hypothetical protein E0W78_10930 [Aeromicrobium sp. IC_218]
MSRAIHVTLLAADPAATVGRLGDAADEVSVVTDPEALVASPESVLVVSGAVEAGLVRAAAALPWRSVVLDLGAATDAETLASLGPARPLQSRWIGHLPVVSLELGGTTDLDPVALTAVSTLLRDRRSEHETLRRQYFLLEADRREHVAAVDRLEADREHWTSEVERLTERARRAERGRRKARTELDRLRRSRAVRMTALLRGLRRRVPGGTAGLAVVLAGAAVVALAAAALVTWLVAETGHAGLAALGVLTLAGLVVTTAVLARLLSAQGRRARTAAETEAERARLAFTELRRGQRSVRKRVMTLDATQEDVVQRLARLELALTNLDVRSDRADDPA